MRFGAGEHQFVVGAVRRRVAVLREGKDAIVRVHEGAKSAFAAEHGLRIPFAVEQGAVAPQAVDHCAQPRIVEAAAKIGAEFGKQAAGAVLPAVDQLARGRLGEDEAQEVALAALAQPADEQMLGRLVPAARVPEPVEAIGGICDRGDGGLKRGGGIGGLGGRRRLRIAAVGKFEQIGALGARQRQRLRQPAQRRRRDLDVAALLEMKAHQVGLMPAFAANSSRRRPGVRRRPPARSGAGTSRGASGRNGPGVAGDRGRSWVTRFVHGTKYTSIKTILIPC